MTPVAGTTGAHDSASSHRTGERLPFADRTDAGRRLARRLVHLRGDDTVVVGIPRGGVPVAAEVAAELGSPLDVIVVRKLGVPFQPELAMGAVGEDGVRVVSDVAQQAGVSDDELAEVERRERAELQRRAERFRIDQPRLPLAGRVVIVVDDGIATGSTARAACQVARAEGARRVVLAVPVAPPDWAERLEDVADELVAVATPPRFFAVGQFYDDFRQTSDDEVVNLLRTARREAAEDAPLPLLLGNGPAARDEDVDIGIGEVRLEGHLTVPPAARGLVVFAHGSGSSRHSPRNRHIARVLNSAGLATLLFDLLTTDEEIDRGSVFDIDLLGTRLVDVTRWARTEHDLGALPVGYFGAHTGAAAALAAAADLSADISAVVSRGGRPDLAGPLLGSVRAPTLLVVGEHDDAVLAVNREAQAHLRCQNRLEVVAGASHLFEEPGTLDQAAAAARDWFLEHLPRHGGFAR